MGLFSKIQKPDPHIIIADVDVMYEERHEWWKFEYKNESFFSPGIRFVMPTRDMLDKCINDVQGLKNDMLKRIEANGSFKNRDRMSKGLEYSFFIEELAVNGSYEISWAGDEWGDLGVDFEVENGKIVDETWGD